MDPRHGHYPAHLRHLAVNLNLTLNCPRDYICIVVLPDNPLGSTFGAMLFTPHRIRR